MGWDRYTSPQFYETGDVLIALTDTVFRQAKPSGKNYTFKNAGGLALFVGPKGAKQWHFRFYWVGKQARISLLVYPAVRLKEARTARDEAHALVSQGGRSSLQPARSPMGRQCLDGKLLSLRVHGLASVHGLESEGRTPKYLVAN